MLYQNRFICKSLTSYIGIALVFVSCFSLLSNAQAKTDDSDKQPMVISIEHFEAYNEVPNISTDIVNLFYPMVKIEDINLALYTGLTATRATDFSIRSTDGGSVMGIGPNIYATVDIMQWRNVSFLFDASGAFIFYNKEFPVGGEQYNFMWRVGPAFSYSFSNSYSIGINYQWMHVSNGQNTSNPGYEAYGFGLQFSKVF